MRAEAASSGSVASSRPCERSAEAPSFSDRVWFVATVGASLMRVMVTVVGPLTSTNPLSWSSTWTVRSVLKVPLLPVLSVGLKRRLSRAVSMVLGSNEPATLKTPPPSFVTLVPLTPLMTPAD